MLNISYAYTVPTCDCCGKTNLARTVCFQDRATRRKAHLGTVCAGAVAGCRLTGNPHVALARLASHVATSGLTFDDVCDLIEERTHAREEA